MRRTRHFTMSKFEETELSHDMDVACRRLYQQEVTMPKSVKGVMHEFKHGELHSGSKKGPVVQNRKQAVAIALSEQRQQGKKVLKKK